MEYIAHPDPVGRLDDNYLAMIDLTPFGYGGWCEQIWLGNYEERTYEVRCIPFRAYGIALGDRVRLMPSKTTVARVVAPSGRRVLRVYLASSQEEGATADATFCIRGKISELGFANEWECAHRVAIDIPPGVNSVPELENMDFGAVRVNYEWADTRPFLESTSGY